MIKINVSDGDLVPFSDYVDNVVLTANTAETVTVPDNAKFALFSATANFWVNANGETAAVPATDTNDGSGCELNPLGRAVSAGDELSIVSAETCLISISYYK